MPIWFCLLALGLSALWDHREGWMGRPLLEAYLLLSLCSCLSIRFAARHQRDDYRDAAQTAINALRQHQVVWWSADSGCAQYYKLPLDTQPNGKNPTLSLPPNRTFTTPKAPWLSIWPGTIIGRSGDFPPSPFGRIETGKWVTHSFDSAEKPPAFRRNQSWDFCICSRRYGPPSPLFSFLIHIPHFPLPIPSTMVPRPLVFQGSAFA